MHYILQMECVECSENICKILIKEGEQELCWLYYHFFDRHFRFIEDRNIPEFILRNEYQLKKILVSKSHSTFDPGKSISFVLIDQFYFLQYSDFQKYIVIDRSKKDLNIKVSGHPFDKGVQIFSDASYLIESETSAYALLIRYPDNSRKIIQRKLPVLSNNLMELRAVIEGIEEVKDQEYIQVNTDSRYVIKGIAQWMHYWKLNDWHTADGTRVKFFEWWQKAELCTRNKVIELKWIKSRSDHPEHRFCDQLARFTAEN